jgi:DNA repair exonuclease SbcCD ATPase subunit
MQAVNAKISGMESDIATLNTRASTRPAMTVEDAEHIINQHADLTTKLLEKKTQRDKLVPMREKVVAGIKGFEGSANSDVEYRLQTAQAIHERYKNILARSTDLRIRAQEEKDRPNPYTELKSQLQADLDNAEGALRQDREKMLKLDTFINQVEYIRRSYHDRNKIKMFILSGIIPTLNKRIEYYLNAFDCDFELRFTPTLSVETGWWDYEYHSGGECKRIDLAVMFALYDVYISLYGAQCNVMVLDEVDGSLDPVGVRSFVDIINNDFSGDRPDKPDTILIISHKTDMVDQFPSQVLVTMDQNRFSHLSVS